MGGESLSTTQSSIGIEIMPCVVCNIKQALIGILVPL